MDQTPAGSQPVPLPPPVRSVPPPPPPPVTSDRWPTVEDVNAGTAGFDITEVQPDSSIVRSRWQANRLWSEDTFQTVRHQLARTAIAFLIALPAGLAVFLVWAAARSAFDERSLGGSIAHSLVRFMFVLLLFVITAMPAAFVLLRDGFASAREFVSGQRYRRILVTVYVAFPITAAIITFVVGNLLIVLLVLFALLILLMVTGGF